MFNLHDCPMPVRRIHGLLLILALLALSLASASGASAAELPAGFQSETVFEGLIEPTNFKFAPDGRTFVAQKNGEIEVFAKGAAPNATPTVFANLSAKTYNYDDHGLLGLALDPKFDEGRPYVYALYTFNHELGTPISKPFKAAYSEKCPEENKCIVSGRLVRLTAEGNKAKESGGEVEEKVLLEGWCQQSTTHSIGDVEFGPEGALFVSGGEGAAFTVPDYGQFENLCGDPPGAKGTPLTEATSEGGSLRSQSLSRPGGNVLLNGTLLRIDPETGEGWPGNPLAASANANSRRIIADGFRNPFRFTLNPRSGEAYVDNVGNGEDEEIDRFPLQSSTVYNSGWPCYEGPERNYQFEVLGNVVCNRLYSAGSTSPPFFYYSHKTVVAPGDPCPSFNGSAISGSAFYEGSTYPSQYDGALFFADSVRGCIYAIEVDEDGDPDPTKVVPFLHETNEYAYAGVDIEQGPEGQLYYVSLVTGTISRINYDPGAPQAKLEADKEYGPVTPTPLKVTFNASKSTIPAGDTAKFEWDLNGDGKFGDGVKNSPVQTAEYGVATNVTVQVRVEDVQTGKTSVARKTVYAGDSPPVVTIAEPPSSLTWSVGQPIKFKGSAVGAVENEGHEIEYGKPMPAKYLYWNIRILHCPQSAEKCHEHPVEVLPAASSGQINAPDHDYPSYLHFFLTATDARGLSAQTEVKIAARPVTLKLRSEPEGFSLVAGVHTETTPFDLSVIEDSPTTIAAPEAAEVGSVRYTFDHWSDGGARVHTVPAAGPAEYIAYYDGPTGPLPTPPTPTPTPQVPAPAPAPTRTPTYSPPKLHKHPGKNTNKTTAKFAFGAAKGLRFKCKLDGKAFGGCKSPRTYKNLKAGSHSFRVYAIDSSGARVTKNTQFNWKVTAGR